MAQAPDIAVSRNGKRVLNVWFGLLVLFLYAPLGLLLLFSFNDNNLPVFPLNGFTTSAYEQFAANSELRTSVVTSAKIAAVSSLIAVLLGLLAAITLVRRHVFGKSVASALLLGAINPERARSHDAAIGVLWAAGVAVGAWWIVRAFA